MNRDYYKRGFDLAVVILANLFLLPVWLVLWIAIPILIWMEDRGPVFYRQNRMGKDGEIFTILKFRTMALGAELHGPPWNIDNDPRVTSVGRFLRRTALDELPEILSVIKGDMSLVGPRPLPVNEQQTLEVQIPGFSERLKVLPGLTGLAQIFDQFDDAPTKLRYDLEYMEQSSPWLDCRLLFLSLRNTFAGRWDNRRSKQTVNIVGDNKYSD